MLSYLNSDWIYIYQFYRLRYSTLTSFISTKPLMFDKENLYMLMPSIKTAANKTF